jgi:hypothetical protein
MPDPAAGAAGLVVGGRARGATGLRRSRRTVGKCPTFGAKTGTQCIAETVPLAAELA